MSAFNRKPLAGITEQQRASYLRDGFIRLEGMYHQSWIDYLRHAVDAIRKQKPIDAFYERGRDGQGIFMIHHQLSRKNPEFKRFSFEGPSAEIAARLMGSSLARLENDQLFIKEPGKFVDTYWHQDSAHHCIDGEHYNCVWLTLDDVDRSQCLSFVRGSHRWGVHFGPRYLNNVPVPTTRQAPNCACIPDIKRYRDSFDIVEIPCRAGDCIVFDMRALHGIDGPNVISDVRRAVATRWCGSDARFRLPVYPSRTESRRLNLIEGDGFGDVYPLVWESTN